MQNNRLIILFATAAVALCVCTSPARADEPAPAGQSADNSAAKLITPEAQKSIDRGLAVLASRQHDDGSFGSGNFRGNVAVTALAGMAMMSSGSTPGRGPYGAQISKCIDYLASCSQKSGLIVAPGATSRGPMYGHGFATLFLAECHGMTARPELREKLVAAVKLIVNTQNNEGGWRYQPVRADADISVTICQIMALRAARNAGVHVPKETVDRCIQYVKRSQNPDGGFMYMLSQGGESLFPRSAAGIVALQSAGIYEGPEISKGIEYLMKFLPKKGESGQMGYYFYGQYYAVQAMWHAGGPSWPTWYNGRPRRLDLAPRPRRQLAGSLLQRLRHRHGLHRPANAQWNLAHFSKIAIISTFYPQIIYDPH